MKQRLRRKQSLTQPKTAPLQDSCMKQRLRLVRPKTAPHAGVVHEANCVEGMQCLVIQPCTIDMHDIITAPPVEGSVATQPDAQNPAQPVVKASFAEDKLATASNNTPSACSSMSRGVWRRRTRHNALGLPRRAPRLEEAQCKRAHGMAAAWRIVAFLYHLLQRIKRWAYLFAFSCSTLACARSCTC